VVGAENYWTLGNAVVATSFAQALLFIYALGKEHELRRRLLMAPWAGYLGIVLGALAYGSAIVWCWDMERQFLLAFPDGKPTTQPVVLEQRDHHRHTCQPKTVQYRTSKSFMHARLFGIVFISFACAGALAMQHMPPRSKDRAEDKPMD